VHGALQIDFWNDVYGFDMSVIKNIALTEPLVDTVNPSSIISNARPVLSLDIATCTKAVSTCTPDWSHIKNNSNALNRTWPFLLPFR
jgi:hypothetical protein